MKHIFFQGNFCARCGNELTLRSWWRPRYLCANCEPSSSTRRLLRLITIIAGLTTLALLARLVAPRPVWLPGPAAGNPPSALDASPHRNPGDKFDFEEEEKVFCGALTRKGTPCRRLVRPGERCRQHRGQPPAPDQRTVSP